MFYGFPNGGGVGDAIQGCGITGTGFWPLYFYTIIF